MPGMADDPSSVLAAADRARQRLAGGLRLPTGLHPALAAAIAGQIGTAAYGIAAQTTTGLAFALVGVAVFAGVAALTLYQFRRINGVRVDDLTSQIVFGETTASTLVYAAAFGAATWAAFESRWWHAYRDDPAGHTGGVSPRVLAVLALFGCPALGALVVFG